MNGTRPIAVIDRVKTLADVAPGASRRWLVGSLVVGIVGTALLVAGGLFDPPQFFRAYLAAYLFCLNAGLGSMVLLMVYHITGGGWGFLVRRLLEAGAKTLPLSAIGFLPIAAGIHYLYPFAGPNAAKNELLRLQREYMNEPLFWGRAVVYFVLWLAIGMLLIRFSRAQDRTGDPWYRTALANVSAIGGVFYGMSIHFAALDWILALEPEYHSTITGPLVVSQQLLTAFALAAIVLTSYCRQPPLSDAASHRTLNDIGNLFLTFVVLWSYLFFFEFMLTWIANLRVDVVWYRPRTEGAWRWITVALALLQFAAPFVLLLFRSVKQAPQRLRAIAVLTLAMQMLFTHFEILPSFRLENIGQWWMSLVAPLGLGGLWLAYFLIRARHTPLLPNNDPNEAKALDVRDAELREIHWEESLVHG